MPPREITIHEVALIDWAPPVATVYVHCSKGTYVRSLVRDAGERAGTGAYMSNLVRVQTGPFSLADAIRLDELDDLLQSVPWEQIAAHPDAPLSGWPAVILGPSEAASWRNGTGVRGPGVSSHARVYDASGNWLGVGVMDDVQGILKPTKVVVEPESL